MKKGILVAALVLLAVFVIACGKQSPQQGTPSPQAAPGGGAPSPATAPTDVAQMDRDAIAIDRDLKALDTSDGLDTVDAAMNVTVE